MFPDMVNDLTIEERLAHAQLMVTVASVDGELVKEELVMIESIMGKSMLHPEMRERTQHASSRLPSPSMGRTQTVPSSVTCKWLSVFLLPGVLVPQASGLADPQQRK